MPEDRRDWSHGQRVRITGTVGETRDALRGVRANVHGVNATYERDGKRWVNVLTDDGRVFAVPSKALKQE